MSKYRLMFLLSKRNNLQNLYKYDTTDIDGQTTYREFDTLEEADIYVENLLNNHGYSKEDILVVNERDFDVSVNIIEDKDDEPSDPGGSETPGILPDNIVYKDVDTNITAKYTFTTLPQSETVPTDSKDLINKAYFDNVIGTLGTLIDNINGEVIWYGNDSRKTRLS